MRRLFDSYRPLHITRHGRFRPDRLTFRSPGPAPRPGLELHRGPGRVKVKVEAWFAGVLNTRLSFTAPKP